jgi:alkyl hydroperoxide reductase subunit AhpF
MAILSEQLKEQLRVRLEERLTGPVEMRLFTRPGSGRLILPNGLGCATCDDARQLAEDVQSAAPRLLELEVIDVSADGDTHEVPTLTLGPPGQDSRIAWQGLTAGYEFATVVDAIERVSRDEPGLSERTMERLAALTDPLEVMVFATPT